MKHIATPENMIWRVARQLEPVSFAELSAAVEREAIEQGIAPFWIAGGVKRLAGRGEMFLVAGRGWMTRSRQEAADARRTAGGA